MVEGAPVVLRPAPEGTARRTAYDLVAVWYAGRWVGVDSRMPPSLVVRAWRAGLLPALDGYATVVREVSYGESRLDLRFDGPVGCAYVEAKSVNLVEGGTALFPDAPTVRGARHLRELRGAVERGHRAAVAFVIQRDDALRLRPYVEADPDFARTLADVVAAGVEAYAIVCEVSPTAVTPVRLVPVEAGQVVGP